MATTLLTTGELRLVRGWLEIIVRLDGDTLTARVGSLRPFLERKVTTGYCIDCFLAAL